MAAPNIVNVATITGKTTVQAVTTSATAIVTNSAASGKVFKVNALYVSNVDGTSAADINVDIFRSSTAYHVAKTVSVPVQISTTMPTGAEVALLLLTQGKFEVISHRISSPSL